MRYTLLKLTVFVLLMGPVGAGAATLTVVGDKLISAWGVVVDGAIYDVAFLDGTPHSQNSCPILYF